jgi:hypothetical protein
MQHAAAYQECDSVAHRDTAQVAANRRTAARGWKVIADQRDGSRRQDGFSQSDDDPGREQFAEAMGEAARQGAATPDQHACKDQIAAGRAIGQEPQRKADEAVNDGERRAEQEAYLVVGDTQIVTDRIDEQTQHLSIRIRQDRGDHENGYDGPGVRPCGVAGIARGMRDAAHVSGH